MPNEFDDKMKKRVSTYAREYMGKVKNEKRMSSEEFGISRRNSVRGFEKVANLQIEIPTIEGIEDLVKNVISGEIRKFGESVPMSAYIFPDFTVDDDTESIINCNGEVVIRYGGRRIAIPFFVREQILLPFQLIEVDKEQFLYSGQNLLALLENLRQAEQDEIKKSGRNPYVGVKDYNSPLNDIGYMEDILRVRELAWPVAEKAQRILPPILASIDNSLCDEIIEKLAKIEKDDPSKTKAIIEAMVKRAVDEMDKIVNSDDDREYSDYRLMLEWLNSRPYWNVMDMDDGTAIEFIENKYKNDFGIYKGRVFKNVYSANYDKAEKRLYANPATMVLSDDGRFILLNSSSNFFATPIDEEDVGFSIIPKVKATGLMPGKWYLYMDTDGPSIPFKVIKSNAEIKRKDPTMGFIYQCIDATGRNFNFVEYKHRDSVDGDAGLGKGYFESISREDLKKRLEEDGSDVGLSLYLLDEEIFLVAPDIELLQLEGKITNYLCDPINFRFTVGENLEKIAGHALLPSGFVKAAFDESNRFSGGAQNRARGGGAYSSIKIIRRQDVPEPLYEVRVRYPDHVRSGRMHHEQLEGVQERALNGLLRKADIEARARAAALQYVKDNPVVVLELNESHTPERLSKDYIAQKTAKIMEDLKRKVFNREMMADTARIVAGTMASGMLDEEIINSMASLGDKAATISRDLCITMEKYAQEYNSEDFLKIAKLLAVKHAWDGFVRKIGKAKDDYSYDSSVLEKTATLSPHLEKAASFLAQLNQEQYEKNEYLVPDRIITQTLDQLSTLNRLAGYSRRSLKG